MISKELLRYPDQFVLYLSKQERDIEDIKRSMKGYAVGRATGRQQIDTSTFATGDAGNGWISARWQNKYGGDVTTGASYTFDIVRT